MDYGLIVPNKVILHNSFYFLIGMIIDNGLREIFKTKPKSTIINNPIVHPVDQPNDCRLSDTLQDPCFHGQDTTNGGGGPVRTCVGWRWPREPLPGSLTQKDAAARGRTRAGSGPARGDRDGLPNQEGSTARHKTNPEEVLPQADGFLAATEA